MLKSMRSTKGASKARRDHINGEIRSLRALLPICAEDQERLSYLHSMSIICTFIRKSVLFTGVCKDSRDISLPHEDILQALPGFIVALTKDGKLVYVSENVSEYLGLSMVDVLQGDTFYDMIDTEDVESVKVILQEDNNVSAERSFVCRMVTSKAFRLQYGSCCSMLVSGRFQGGPPNSALFVGLCTPTVNRLRDFQFLSDSTYFQTLHKPDMNFAYAPHSVFFHLGFSAQELICRSWYGLLHPDDLTLAAGLHKSLIGDDGDADVQMVVRLQRKDLSWVWIYIWANMDVGKQVIACKNHIISETEAIYLKQKLYGNVSMSSSKSVCSAVLSQGPWGLGTRRSLKRQSEREMPRDEPRRRKSRRTSEDDRHHSVTHGDSRSEEPAFFCTPPYSPTSSHSSDFLSEGYDALDLLICDGTPALHQFSPSSPDVSSQAFPLSSLSVGCHPYSSPPCDLHTRVPDTHLVPVPNVCEGMSDCILHPEDLDSFLLHQTHGRAGVYPESLESGSSPVGALTPESSPTAERCFHYDERGRDEISILAHQICSLASSFDAYGTQTSVHLNGALCWPHASELLLDERVIDGVLHDLDVVSAREHCVQGLAVASGARVQALSMDTLVHFGSLEPVLNTQNCCEINSELHQLNHCLYGDIREDGLTEESMY